MLGKFICTRVLHKFPGLFLGVNLTLNRSKSEPLANEKANIPKMAISRWPPSQIWKIHNIKQKNDVHVFNGSNSFYEHPQYQQKFSNRYLIGKGEIQNGRQVRFNSIGQIANFFNCRHRNTFDSSKERYWCIEYESIINIFILCIHSPN